jgi:hypothetical protein
MIINGNAGGALNDLVETSLMLNANHVFWENNRKNYLEIPNITLSTGIINTVLIYIDTETSTLADGTIYHLYKTKNQYDTGTVIINGRVYYKNNGGLSSSFPFNPNDNSEFIYDASTNKVKIFIGYISDLFMQANLYYHVVIW